jgi:hypothetical protein
VSWVLVGADGRPYESAAPGTLGGHRRTRIYGRLDCPSAARALARGGYVAHRVFFANEPAAVAAGYRPCSVCLPERYRAWRALTLVAAMDAARVGVGHARDSESSALAAAFVDAWTDRGGEVTAVVSWPAEAASWLRQARALTVAAPDAWLIAGPIASLRRVCDRLSTSTDWDPARTVAFAIIGNGTVIGRADSIVTAGQRPARAPIA